MLFNPVRLNIRLWLELQAFEFDPFHVRLWC